MQTNPLLQEPIGKLPLSDSFKIMATINNLSTLNDLLEKKVSEMMSLPKFNYHTLEELVKFLQKNGLTDCLRES